MSAPTPSPHHDDAGATPTQLLAAAANDYTQQQAYTRDEQAQGGPGIRQGVLPGENR